MKRNFTLIEILSVTLLISLLAACTPTGTMVTAIAQVHGGDAESASAINMTSTALCILTIPCIVWLYQI
jgi:predicted permease